ncbi:MAG: hypothetical protein IJW18_05255 [Lachnospiraceae bacterium]|nr:hypothetical protein [Lachnospiraceae bacterium]
MYELEKYDFFHTSKIIVAALILVGAVLLLGLAWIFIVKMGMSVGECKYLGLMAVLFVIVVIGAVKGA